MDLGFGLWQSHFVTTASSIKLLKHSSSTIFFIFHNALFCVKCINAKYHNTSLLCVVFVRLSWVNQVLGSFCVAFPALPRRKWLRCEDCATWELPSFHHSRWWRCWSCRWHWWWWRQWRWRRWWCYVDMRVAQHRMSSSASHQALHLPLQVVELQQRRRREVAKPAPGLCLQVLPLLPRPKPLSPLIASTIFPSIAPGAP